MTSIFRRNMNGLFAYTDPAGNLIWSVASWIENATFVTARWLIDDVGSPSPAMTGPQINAATVTVDEVDYAAGEIASTFISGLSLGRDYVVTIDATFSTGERDVRRFTLYCRNQ